MDMAIRITIVLAGGMGLLSEKLFGCVSGDLCRNVPKVELSQFSRLLKPSGRLPLGLLSEKLFQQNFEIADNIFHRGLKPIRQPQAAIRVNQIGAGCVVDDIAEGRV